MSFLRIGGMQWASTVWLDIETRFQCFNFKIVMPENINMQLQAT